MIRFISGLFSFYIFLIVCYLLYMDSIGEPAGWREVPTAAWKSAQCLVKIFEYIFEKIALVL